MLVDDRRPWRRWRPKWRRNLQSRSRSHAPCRSAHPAAGPRHSVRWQVYQQKLLEASTGDEQMAGMAKEALDAAERAKKAEVNTELWWALYTVVTVCIIVAVPAPPSPALAWQSEATCCARKLPRGKWR